MKRKKKKHRPIHELIFTDEELCQFWHWFNEHWTDDDWYYRAFYVGLILVTGLRMSEARQIKVEHCSTFPVPLIYIPKESAKQGKPREVEMLPQFELLFKQRITELRKALNQKGKHVSPYLFPGQAKWPDYDAICEKTGDNWWHEVLDAAGLRSLPTHTGRRCFATYARITPYPDEKGTPRYLSDMDLQQQLGHEDLATTAKCYVKSIPGSRFPRNGSVWAPKWPDVIGG